MVAPVATEMLELARPECLRLLAATEVWRIAVSFTEWDHPVIRPVNYMFARSRPPLSPGADATSGLPFYVVSSGAPGRIAIGCLRSTGCDPLDGVSATSGVRHSIA